MAGGCTADANPQVQAEVYFVGVRSSFQGLQAGNVKQMQSTGQLFAAALAGTIVGRHSSDSAWREDKGMHDQELLREALAEAKAGLAEGGLPIGSVLADEQGRIVGRGHNLRVQSGDPTAHAEVVCIRHAGRRRDWNRLTLVSTLSPCVMCTGTALLFRIPRVIVGENLNFRGAEELFQAAGVALNIVDDPECIALMRKFIAVHPDLWNEDIGK